MSLDFYRVSTILVWVKALLGLSNAIFSVNFIIRLIEESQWRMTRNVSYFLESKKTSVKKSCEVFRTHMVMGLRAFQFRTTDSLGRALARSVQIGIYTTSLYRRICFDVFVSDTVFITARYL